MNQPVSVAFLVAAYNVDAYLDECLSAISQVATAHDEVIIVNDGSADKTQTIAEHWCERNKSQGAWRCINQTNQGLSAVRRVGMLAASTEYVLFADGDDQLVPEGFQALRTVLCSSRPAMLLADYYEWTPGKTELLRRSKRRSHPPSALLTDQVVNLTQSYEDGVPCVWGRIIKRDLLLAQNEHIFPEWSMFDDLPSTPFLMAAANSIWYEPVPFVKYRSNPSSLTKVYSNRSCIDLARATVHASFATDLLPREHGLETARSRMVARKFRDNLKLAKRVAVDQLILRRQIVRLYERCLPGQAGWLGLFWALLTTKRFGDVKALLVVMHHFCLPKLLDR